MAAAAAGAAVATAAAAVAAAATVAVAGSSIVLKDPLRCAVAACLGRATKKAMHK